MKFTLLGTGAPPPNPERRGPSQLVEIDNTLILIDAGTGVVHRLLEAGYSRPALAQVVLTHLHSDHLMGLPDLLWSGWIMRWWDTPPRVAGPPGTVALIAHLLEAFDYDIRVRAKGERLKPEWLRPQVEEIEAGWSVSGSDWQLHAFRVDHQQVDQAFGVRLDAAASSLVISGDTRPCENLILHARGADLLVHEVYWSGWVPAAYADSGDPDVVARRHLVRNYHTSSLEVGKIASAAGVKRLVLTHVLMGHGTFEAIVSDVRKDFAGPVTIGTDLAVFTL